MRRIQEALEANPLDSVRPGNRPYGRLISVYAQARQLDRAEMLHQEFLRLVPERLRGSDYWASEAEGQLALARGDGKAAVADFRRAREIEFGTVFALFDEARAFEQLGQVDSAAASYERLLGGVSDRRDVEESRRDFALPIAFRRLGEIYEAKGDRAKALEYYGKFATLWKDADPELQPKVQEVRRKLAALGVPPIK